MMEAQNPGAIEVMELAIDGIRVRADAPTQLPVPALNANDTHVAMTQQRRDRKDKL